MKARYLVLTVLSAGCTTPAMAIDLTCGGVMHTYRGKHIEGSVQPQATTINLEEKYITTPVGEFDIKTVSEGSISFGDEGKLWKDVNAFGTLDRITGLMTVFWRNPNDPSHMAAYSELHCSAAKRLF